VIYGYAWLGEDGEHLPLPGWVVASLLVAPVAGLVAGLVSQKITDRRRRVEEEAARIPALADSTERESVTDSSPAAV
jgi:hypothetical protein